MTRSANRHSTSDECLPVLPHPGLEHPEHEQHHQEGQGERGPHRFVRPGRPVTDLRQQTGLVLHLDLHNIGVFQEMIRNVLNAVTGFSAARNVLFDCVEVQARVGRHVGSLHPGAGVGPQQHQAQHSELVNG